MHLIQFRQIMRDAEVAHAIQPLVRRHRLSAEDTTKALIACGVPRAANVAQITRALDMTADTLTERKSLARGDSAPAVEAAIPVDSPASKNN
jgi:hypothetical protein